MNTDVLDQTGKKVSQVTLSEAIFQATVRPALVAQAIRVRLMNAKVGTASTKTRAEVRGGGRKPWRQKGTGRARQGSIRSPQWAGGGIVHGPRPHKPELQMPQSMRRAALFSALTEKFGQKQVMVVDQIHFEKPKAKAMQQVLTDLKVGRSVLVVVSDKKDDLEQSSRNLQGVKLMSARVLHPYEILRYQTVIFMKDSLSLLEETFVPKQKDTRIVEDVKPEPRAKKSEKPAKKAEE